MSSVNLLGDVSELRSQSVVVPATYSGTGHNVSGHFKLADTAELKHYIEGHAVVDVSGEILLEVSGPVSSTAATTAVVALYPDKYPDAPTTKSHVLSLEGRVSIQHSLLVASVIKAPGKAREVGDSLKIKTLVDYPPVVAFHVDVAGGSASSTWTLTAHVPIALSGVSHKKTW